MLHQAIKKGDIPAIQKLIDNGEDPNIILTLAVLSQNRPLLEAVIHHPKFKFTKTTMSTIWIGIDVGQADLLYLLLEQKTLPENIQKSLKVIENRVTILAAIDKLDIKDPNALMFLKEPGITVTKTMLAQYREAVYTAYRENPDKIIEFKRIKKNKGNRPLSVHLIHDEPCLILPTTQSWKRRMVRHKDDKNLKLTYPKGMISLRDGELLHVKVYRPESINDGNPKELSKRENANAKAIGNLSAQRSRETQKGTVAYLYGNYIPGKDINKIIKHDHISLSEALTISQALCQAVRQVHEKGFIHFDIKPGNAIYNEITGKVTLIDFEAAVKQNTQGVPYQCTPAYTHPDVLYAFQYKKRINFDCSIDAYSLIMTIIEILTACHQHEDARMKPHIEGLIKDLQRSIARPKDLDKIPSMQDLAKWLDKLPAFIQAIASPAASSPSAAKNSNAH